MQVKAKIVWATVEVGREKKRISFNKFAFWVFVYVWMSVDDEDVIMMNFLMKFLASPASLLIFSPSLSLSLSYFAVSASERDEGRDWEVWMSSWV